MEISFNFVDNSGVCSESVQYQFLNSDVDVIGFVGGASESAMYTVQPCVPTHCGEMWIIFESVYMDSYICNSIRKCYE